eukprot:CAMPEP_0185903698 /NCGR_PEP_ID=MMETSP0196C-20130402/2977_1 /TAXON_ID=2932 /ORGANISM="Alexandrium fundyense, Strain CCMP1719" /LENGTH=50 /DNA_ID=CAMNT_0028622809 /DNA_START=158 /DNA_END=306 /DNA_ORIENTATION=-
MKSSTGRTVEDSFFASWPIVMWWARPICARSSCSEAATGMSILLPSTTIG